MSNGASQLDSRWIKAAIPLQNSNQLELFLFALQLEIIDFKRFATSSHKPVISLPLWLLQSETQILNRPIRNIFLGFSPIFFHPQQVGKLFKKLLKNLNLFVVLRVLANLFKLVRSIWIKIMVTINRYCSPSFTKLQRFAAQDAKTAGQSSVRIGKDDRFHFRQSIG